MGVRRTALEFEGQYVQIPNAWLRDKRLSRRARGLLAEIMSHRVGWHVTTRTLATAGPEGRDAVRTALAELVDAGYLRRAQGRGEGGTFGEIEYELSEPTVAGFSGRGDETPDQTVAGFTVAGSTVDGESDTKKTISIEDHQEESNTGRRSAAHPLPEDWSPNVRCRTFAMENGVDVEHEAGQFRAHAEANDRRQRDWDAAFRQWLGNAVKWRREKQPDAGLDFGRDEWMYRA